MSIVVISAILISLASKATSVDPGEVRIIGGTQVKRGELPFLARLHSGGRFICGGSIIDHHHILTAAHCVPQSKHKELVAKVGCHQMTECKNYKIKDDKIHPFYHTSSSSSDYDIAILKTDRPIEFTDSVRSIELAGDMEDDYSEGEVLTVAGWGSTGVLTASPIALKVNVTTIALEVCKKNYPVEERHICAGSEGRDSCHGDSGGPLFRTEFGGEGHTQVGIVSYGRDCGDEAGGVYTRVAPFRSWIKSVIACWELD